MNRLIIEEYLEELFLNRVISFLTMTGTTVAGKVHRIAAEYKGEELTVIFTLDHTRYECSFEYFLTYTKRHVNPSSGSPGVI